MKTGKKVWVFDPCGWDLFDHRDYMPDAGTRVVKTQPAGAPKNGTMNHCYVATEAGEFLGLVHENSLVTPAEYMASHDHHYTDRVAVPLKMAGAVTGYSEYVMCSCGSQVPWPLEPPFGGPLTQAGCDGVYADNH